VPSCHNYHSHHQLPNISVAKCKNNSPKFWANHHTKSASRIFVACISRCNRKIVERQELIKNSIASTFKLQQEACECKLHFIFHLSLYNVKSGTKMSTSKLSYFFSRTRRPQQHITQGWVDYQQLFHFPICCQQISIHTHVPIINLIYIQLHDSLNKHVNIVYWQNCANKCRSQHHDISSVLLSCFPEFNVPYEECSALTFNSAQRNQLQDTVSDWEYAFVTA